jgi:hypothetical protein
LFLVYVFGLLGGGAWGGVGGGGCGVQGVQGKE